MHEQFNMICQFCSQVYVFFVRTEVVEMYAGESGGHTMVRTICCRCGNPNPARICFPGYVKEKKSHEKI